MKKKVIFGIILPLSIIVLLIIISTSNIGYSIYKESARNIEIKEILVDHRSKVEKIPLQTITITNDLFLPRKYELPTMIACLYDKQGIKKTEEIEVFYNKRTNDIDSDFPIFDEIFFMPQRDSKQNKEVSAFSKTQIRLMIQKKYIVLYHDSIDSYMEYDELLLIEYDDTSRYKRCERIDNEDIESAIRIPIIS